MFTGNGMVVVEDKLLDWGMWPAAPANASYVTGSKLDSWLSLVYAMIDVVKDKCMGDRWLLMSDVRWLILPAIIGALRR